VKFDNKYWSEVRAVLLPHQIHCYHEEPTFHIYYYQKGPEAERQRACNTIISTVSGSWLSSTVLRISLSSNANIMTLLAKKSNIESSSPPPPKEVLLIVYLVLGGLLSFFAGREPGTLPDNIHAELAPVLIVACGFLVSYSLWDVMEVGIAKQEAKYPERSYAQLCGKPEPERLYLAQRVQTNQVEQMPAFLFGSLSCALFVNGNVAGIMALAWAILRRMYASTYRKAVGAPSMVAIGLVKFTVPCYFLCNSMLMASAVHAVRCLVVTSRE
jgi:MAPEG family